MHMARYRTEPHDDQGQLRESEGNDGGVESIEATFSDAQEEIFFCSGYGALEIAKKHQADLGGTIYLNSVSRRIVRKGYHLSSNAPVSYAVSNSPVYTVILKNEQLLRAYWPPVDA